MSWVQNRSQEIKGKYPNQKRSSQFQQGMIKTIRMIEYQLMNKFQQRKQKKGRKNKFRPKIQTKIFL